MRLLLILFLLISTPVFAVTSWDGGLPGLPQPCSTDEIPKANADGTWRCAADAGAAGGDSITVDGGAVVDPDFDDGGDINFINTTNTITATMKANTVSADELNAGGVEAELEAVMDLQDMQGAVTDAQVPDSITITDNATVTGTQTLTNKTLTTPIISGKTDADGGTVSDDDCTGEQGFFWFDDTDNAFEFCDANSGTPSVLGEGGGSVSPPPMYFSALSLEFINAGDSFPAPAKDTGTNIDINVLAFDAGTDECAGKNFAVPAGLDTGGTVTFKVVYYPATASTNSVYWDFKHLAVDNDESWDQALTTESDGGCAGINTQDDLVECEWTETVSNLGWAVGDTVEFEVCRDADNASDNLVGDANLVNFQVILP